MLFIRSIVLCGLLLAAVARLDAQCGALVFNPMTRRFDCIGVQGGGGGGITSLNGLNAASQTFATPGTTGTAPNWVSAVGTHTLNIPLASTAGVTLGGISKAFYDTIVITSGSYANPAWITSLAGSKITGNISGNAANVTGTVAVANGGTGLVAGTSGGILGFTGTGTLASSGVLSAGLPVIGGGAGVTPTVGTRSGNTTTYVTTTGAQTNGRCVEIDANGNHIQSAAPCGGSGLGVEDVQLGSVSTSPTFTVGVSKSLSSFTATLIANIASSTLATTNATDGQEILLKLCADGSARTFVLPANVTGTGPLNIGANKCAHVLTLWDGTNAGAKSVVYVSGGSGPSFIDIPDGSGGVQTVTVAVGGGTATVPAGTYALLGDTLTQAVTNKTISGGSNTITGLGASSFPTGNAMRKGGFGAVFNGNGSALTSGTTPGSSLLYTDPINYGCTIVAFKITVAPSGTAGFRVWRANASTTNLPVVGNTITTADLAISANTTLRSTTLANFSSTTINAGDVFAIHLNAASTATWATFGVECEK